MDYEESAFDVFALQIGLICSTKITIFLELRSIITGIEDLMCESALKWAPMKSTSTH
jgi:hypothetical protein